MKTKFSLVGPNLSLRNETFSVSLRDYAGLVVVGLKPRIFSYFSVLGCRCAQWGDGMGHSALAESLFEFSHLLMEPCWQPSGLRNTIEICFPNFDESPFNINFVYTEATFSITPLSDID